MNLPASEFKPCVSRFCLEEWQDIWNSAVNNKLHAIYPTVGKCVHNNLDLRRDAVIINRSVTLAWHTLTYFLEMTNQHVQSVTLRDVRLKYFTAPSYFFFVSIYHCDWLWLSLCDLKEIICIRWAVFSLHGAAPHRSLYCATPLPSTGPFPCAVSEKFHSVVHPKSHSWNSRFDSVYLFLNCDPQPSDQ